jgi:probable rRNA maturation factor
MKIKVIEAGPRTSPIFRKKLTKMLTIIAEKEGVKAELNCILTTDNYLRKLNRTYLGKNRPTDVISFAIEDIWEIYISVDTARKRAYQYGFDAEYEIYRYGVHGLLHLIGYDHKDLSMAQAMEEKEEKYLDLWYQS